MSSILERTRSDVLDCPEGSPYLFSTDDFYRMVDLFIFPFRNRAALWDGIVYEKPINTTLRAAVGMMINEAIIPILPSGWFVSLNNSLTISPNTAPTPDMVVIREEPDDYLDRRPEAADVGLVIEMADGVLKNDVGRKLSAYASAGIPVYWVVDLAEIGVRVYSDPIPSEGRFASAATFAPDQSILFTLGGVALGSVAASDLLPIR